jgi:EF-P beta-lysylation protein EpmB
LIEESRVCPGFTDDPVKESAARCCPRLLKKYHGRALLVVTSACAMHCRFCFRKNFPYEGAPDGFLEELQTIASDRTIQEIILSGGDPLSLSNESLRSLLASLSQIPHLRRLRFHTRFPISIPERIDEELLDLLSRHPQPIYFVLHINHPREIDDDILRAIRSIQRLGIAVLCQTVLLRKINDDESTMLTLCETLVNAGILPYYLHLLDRVEGSSHFEVSAERGMELTDFLHKKMSGYGVPRLVREEANQPGKTILTSGRRFASREFPTPV